MGCVTSKDESFKPGLIQTKGTVLLKSTSSTPTLNHEPSNPLYVIKQIVSEEDRAVTERTGKMDESCRTVNTDGSEQSEHAVSEHEIAEDEPLSKAEIEARRSVETGSTTYNFGSSGTSRPIEYAVCTQRGYYPNDPNKANQDSYSVSLDFADIKKDSSLFSVYDGHGPKGEVFAQFAKDQLPLLMAQYVKEEQQAKVENVRAKKKIKSSVVGSLPLLNVKEYQQAARKAHVKCNQRMLDEHPKNDTLYSGTTATSVAIHNGKFIVPNCGDSRVILGTREKKGGPIIAKPLSRDHTAWRKDERHRIVKSGGRILSIGQIEGFRPLGDDEYQNCFGDQSPGEKGFSDTYGDAPRVWLKTKGAPGTAFTRSLGDAVANEIGVHAEPEFISKEITNKDKILVIATDGVFEFLSNQRVMRICSKASSGIDACEEIVKLAYDEWMTNEGRTDDITVIVLYLGDAIPT